MNDAISDGANAVSLVDSREATQVLRLNPEGLRRLADIDEAITELHLARRLLIANRAASIGEALDAVRNDHRNGSSANRPTPSPSSENDVSQLSGELRALRGEIAGIRQELGDVRRTLSGDPEAELHMLRRRLRYLEAELENREI
ncbi:MAG: hypothetical protein WD273_14340 [Trueperaceae bacterium]